MISCSTAAISIVKPTTRDTALFSSKVCLHNSTEQFDKDLAEGNNQVLEVAEYVSGDKQGRAAKYKLLYCLSLSNLEFSYTVQDEFGINKENEVFPIQSSPEATVFRLDGVQ